MIIHYHTEDFAADIHKHNTSPFVGVGKVSLHWNRNTLTLVPSIVISGAIEELANIAMNLHSHSSPESLVCLWWDAIQSSSFP